jgi:hypothetical protein
MLKVSKSLGRCAVSCGAADPVAGRLDDFMLRKPSCFLFWRRGGWKKPQRSSLKKKHMPEISQRRDHRVVSVHPEFERNYFGGPFWQLRTVQ